MINGSNPCPLLHSTRCGNVAPAARRRSQSAADAVLVENALLLFLSLSFWNWFQLLVSAEDGRPDDVAVPDELPDAAGERRDMAAHHRSGAVDQQPAPSSGSNQIIHRNRKHRQFTILG